MGKRLESTPRSKVRAAIRRLWLQSRERSAALKSAKHCCEECGVKASKAKGKEQKVEVHHMAENIPWEPVIDYIFRHILTHPDTLEVLCPECHKERHRGEHE